MTVASHGTTGAGTSNNWGNSASPAALDGVFATRAVARRSPNTAYWAIPAFTEIPDGSTINSVILTVANRVSTTGSDPTLDVDLTLGTSITGNAVGNFSQNTAVHNDSWIIYDVTLAQLKASNLQVRTVDDRDSSSSVTISIDQIKIEVDYTAQQGSHFNAYVNGQWVTGELKRYDSDSASWKVAVVKRRVGTSWNEVP